jgi:hypothetical protein
MKCQECVAKLPYNIKTRIEAYWRKHQDLDKEQKDTPLSQLLIDPAMVQCVYTRLFRLERDLLKCIIQFMGYESFTLEQLEKRVSSSYSGAECRVALIRLQQKGIVFTYSKAWGEHIYMIPADTFPLWIQACFTPFHTSKKQTEITDLLSPEHANASFELLTLVSYTALNGLPLTQRGTVHKRHVQKLQQELVIQDGDFQVMDLKYAHQEIYPPAFAILLDIALRIGLLDHEAEAVTIQTDILQNWLKLSPQRSAQLSLLTFQETHMPQEIWLQLAWMSLWGLPIGEWILVKDLLRWMQTNQVFMPEEDLEQELIDRGFKPLAAMGWLDIGADAEGLKYFRLSVTQGETNIKQYNEHLYVQPDFEIMVPPHVPLAVHWELMLFADLIQRDQVSRYRLSQASVDRAYQQGRKSEDILSFLQSSSVKIPDNVNYSIEDWYQQFGRLSIEKVTLLKCKDKELADQLMEQAIFMQSIIEPLNELVFVVKADQLPALEKWLIRQGIARSEPQTEQPQQAYLKMEETARVADQLPSLQTDRKVRGLVYSRGAVHYYTSLDVIPAVEDVYPSMDQIPSLWLKALRPYHHSIRREMVEQALAYKALLKINKKGESVHFTPVQVTEKADGWAVRGLQNKKEITLFHQDWEEMQLILPGINDNNEV